MSIEVKNNCWQCEDRDSGKQVVQMVDIMGCGHTVCSLCGKPIPSKENELVHTRMFSVCFNCKDKQK